MQARIESAKKREMSNPINGTFVPLFGLRLFKRLFQDFLIGNFTFRFRFHQINSTQEKKFGSPTSPLMG
jgi:hypothetical protein